MDTEWWGKESEVRDCLLSAVCLRHKLAASRPRRSCHLLAAAFTHTLIHILCSGPGTARRRGETITGMCVAICTAPSSLPPRWSGKAGVRGCSKCCSSRMRSRARPSVLRAVVAVLHRSWQWCVSCSEQVHHNLTILSLSLSPALYPALHLITGSHQHRVCAAAENLTSLCSDPCLRW